MWEIYQIQQEAANRELNVSHLQWKTFASWFWSGASKKTSKSHSGVHQKLTSQAQWNDFKEVVLVCIAFVARTRADLDQTQLKQLQPCLPHCEDV